MYTARYFELKFKKNPVKNGTSTSFLVWTSRIQNSDPAFPTLAMKMKMETSFALEEAFLNTEEACGIMGTTLTSPKVH